MIKHTLKTILLFVIICCIVPVTFANTSSLTLEEIKTQIKEQELNFKNKDYEPVIKLLDDITIYWYSEEADVEFQKIYSNFAWKTIEGMRGKDLAPLLLIYNKILTLQGDSIILDDDFNSHFYNGQVYFIKRLLRNITVSNIYKKEYILEHREQFTQLMINAYKQIHQVKKSKLWSTYEVYDIMDKYSGGCFNLGAFVMKPVSEHRFKEKIEDCNRDDEKKKELISNYSKKIYEYSIHRRKELAKESFKSSSYKDGRGLLRKYFNNNYFNNQEDITLVENALKEAMFDEYYIEDTVNYIVTGVNRVRAPGP